MKVKRERNSGIALEENPRLSRVDRPLFLLNAGCIRPSIETMFDDGRIKSRHFCVQQGKDIMKLFKKVFLRGNLFRRIGSAQKYVFRDTPGYTNQFPP